jgi:glycine hydroxymethyltransferase
MVDIRPLSQVDPEIAALIREETERQEYGLEMIPSENFVSEAVLEVNGSCLTNKYAEGLPHKRYYGGCEVVDKVEELANERAKKLFGCDFVNSQPHSGAQANQAVYHALLSPGDTLMGMRLDHGGHLTHGSPVNFSGIYYKVVAYGVREDTHLIDMDQVRDIAKAHKPKIIVTGASSYSRHIDFAAFRQIADEVGAFLLADIAHYSGLVAAGEYPNPVPVCDVVTTTTHKTLRGPRSGIVMAREQFKKAINKAVFPGLQGGPHMHTIAAKAVAFLEALQPSFKEYQQKVISNARVLAGELQAQGFAIVSGGTDSHLLVVDLRPVGTTGKIAQEVLDLVGITGNKNGLPYDPQPPTICSGIRLGTPALTSRGMGHDEMKRIAQLIKEVLSAAKDSSQAVPDKVLNSVRDEVREISKRFPLYPHRLVR